MKELWAQEVDRLSRQARLVAKVTKSVERIRCLFIGRSSLFIGRFPLRADEGRRYGGRSKVSPGLPSSRLDLYGLVTMPVLTPASKCDVVTGLCFNQYMGWRHEYRRNYTSPARPYLFYIHFD